MRRRKDPFEKPLVIVAAIVGIIAVVIIALFFFQGSGSLSGSSGSSAAASTAVVGVAPSVIKTQTPVTVPGEGLYVRVSYLGAFSGTYGMPGNMTSARDSGSRVYAVDNATGTVSATFRKLDSSAHDIVVEIWKNGAVQKSETNTTSYGEASVTYTV